MLLTFTDTIADLNVTPNFTEDVWLAECERILSPLWTERFPDRYPPEVARLAMRNLMKKS